MRSCRPPSFSFFGTFAAIAIALLGEPITAAENLNQGLRTMQTMEARLVTVGYRLAVASGDLCPNQVPLTGLAVHDLSEYSASIQPAVRRYFGASDLPQIIAVAKGSPAEEAGILANDSIAGINGLPPPPGGGSQSLARTDAVIDMLTAAAKEGAIELTLLREAKPVQVTLRTRKGCASRFVLEPSGSLNSLADGDLVTITTAMMAYAGDDAQVAALLGHEIAHNILQHRLLLDEQKVTRGFLQQFGRNARFTRATETEADRYGVYLLYRANYPMEAIVNFWTRYRHDHGLGILRAPTHAGEKVRIATIRAEITRIAAMTAAGIEPRPDFGPYRSEFRALKGP